MRNYEIKVWMHEGYGYVDIGKGTMLRIGNERYVAKADDAQRVKMIQLAMALGKFNTMGKDEVLH